MATNPNPFLRSPLDTFSDDTEQGTAQLLASIPEPVPEPVPAATPAMPVTPAAKRVRPSTKPGDFLPPADLMPLFKATSDAYQVPVNVLMALAHQESRYNAGAVGVETKWGKAKGMMQNLDATAKGLGIDAMNPNEAVPAAAFQIRQRLDKGMSMAEAIKEHFAGPDRKQWGEKTEAYGNEVMEKVGAIGKLLMDMPDDAPAKPAVDPTKDKADPNRMSTSMARDAYMDTFRANNPKATLGAIQAAMNQYNADQAARAQATPAADKFAQMADPVATFDAKLDAKLATRQKAKGVVPGMPSTAQPAADPMAPTDTPSLVNDVQRGARNVQALGYGLAGLAADAAGFDKKADALLNEYIDITNNNLRDNPAAIGTYKNVKDLGDAGRYAVEAVLENVTMILPSLVTGGVGALAARKAAEKVVGGMIQKQVAQGIAKSVAEKNALQFIARRVTMGATAGAAASSVGMESGSIMGDIYRETGEKASGTALAYGLPAGLLDTIGPVMALRKIAGPVVDEVAGHVIKRLGVEVGKQFLAEAGTEGLQTLIEKAAVRSVDGKELFNAELADELIDATLKGGIGGAAMGGVSQGVAELRTPAPSKTAPVPADAAPAPVADAPLAAAVERAAAPDARVVVEAPDGQAAAGTVKQYAEAESGEFAAEIMGDDGQVYTITDRDGLKLSPVAADAGPLTASLAQGAAALPAVPDAVADPVVTESAQMPAPDAEPTPAPTAEMPAAEALPEQVEIAPPQSEEAAAQPLPDAMTPEPAPEVARAPADMSDLELSERLKYIANVAKVNGASKMTVEARREVEREINRREKIAQTEGAGHDARRGTDGQPGIRHDPVRVLDDGRAGDTGDSGRGRDDGIGSGDPAAVLGQRRAGAGSAGMPGTGGAAVGSGSADAKPSLKDSRGNKSASWVIRNKETGEVVMETFDEKKVLALNTAKYEAVAARDYLEQLNDSTRKAEAAPPQPSLTGKPFASLAQAEKMRAKNGLADTHDVIQTGKVRWEVLPKGEAPPKSKWQEKEAARAAKLEAQLATANANASARKAEKADEPPVADGMTRLYHGGDVGRYDGDAWYSTDRKYAQGYATKDGRTGAEVQYVDYPTEKVDAWADPDGYGQTPAKGFHTTMELSSSVTGPRKPIAPPPSAQPTEPQAITKQIESPAVKVPEVAPAAKPAKAKDQDEPWRTSITKARAYAKELGISTKDKSIFALVEQIDATLADTIDNIDVARIKATMADPEKSDAIMAGIEDAVEAQTGKRPSLTSKANMQADTVESAPTSKPEVAPELDADPQESMPATPIADFGEKLEGARKDLWASYQRDMKDELPADAKDITLSKHFPEPNYEALIASGVPVETLAAVKAMRDEIPAKPRVPYKLRAWAGKVTVLREFASDLLGDKVAFSDLMHKMRVVNGSTLGKFADRIEMYAALGYPLFTKANGYSIESGDYGMFESKEYKPPIRKYSIEKDSRTLGYYDSREDAIASLRERLTDAQPVAKGGAVKLDLYRLTGSNDIIIGKKVGAGKFIDLKEGFKSVREAREYLAAHQDELATLLEKKKDVRPERRSVNSPRVGTDRRKGEDISPEKFGETFGFRGVQFGNYVEQKRRAVDLNNAYDALIDMAELIGIPPQAISLNGTLGLAFGARGAGGKNAAAAHYEPEKVVINLTKTNGAGSLAHEWFHGLDNYFERMRGAKGAGHVTDNPVVKKIATAERKLVDDESVRPEALAAFKGVMDAIKASGMPKRSRALDARRSKDYWSTTHEMVARAFESYVIDKAAEQNLSNDYLANIVSEDAHNVTNEAFNMDEPFPYPTRAEAPTINAAFDALFATLKTKEQDGKTALYSAKETTEYPIAPRDEWYGEGTFEADGGRMVRVSPDEYLAAVRPLTMDDESRENIDLLKEHILAGKTLDPLLIRANGKEDGRHRAHAAKELGIQSVPVIAFGDQFKIAPKFSAGKPGNLTAATLRQSLTTGNLGPVINAMIDGGMIVLHDTGATLPQQVRAKAGNTQAVTMPDGKVHLVAANLTRANARAVMLHEAFHQGGQKLIGTVQWKELMRRLSSMYSQGKESSGKAGEFFAKARKRVASGRKLGMVDEHMQVEEFGAYAIEEYESAPPTVRKWVDDLVGMVKAWVLVRFGAQLGQVTPGQLSAMAKMAIMDVAVARRADLFGKAGEFFSAGKTIEVDGVRRPIENSRGQMIGQSLADQRAFWKWAGDTKAVDDEGRPLTLYHGTGADIDQFDPLTLGQNTEAKSARGAFFFTSSPKVANGYASLASAPEVTRAAQLRRAANAPVLDEDTAAFMREEASKLEGSMEALRNTNAFNDTGFVGGGNVLPIYLSMQNPLVHDFAGEEYRERTYAALIKEAKEIGHDGVIFRNTEDSMHKKYAEISDIYAVFSPKQIKSATGNNGQFDPANPDIRFSAVLPLTEAAEDQDAGAQTSDQATSFRPPDQGFLRRMQGLLQDNMNRLKQVQETIEKVTGVPIREVIDAYGAYSNMPGRKAARIEDGEINLFEPLMERLAKAGHTMDQLTDLMHAQHAKERNDHIRTIDATRTSGSGMTYAKAKDILDRYSDDGFTSLHRLADDARKINKAVLEMKLAYGLIEQEDYDHLTTFYKFYVPLKGDHMEEDGTPKRGFGAKIHRAMGHGERDERILENIMRDFRQAIVVGERNLADQVLLKMAITYPDEALWTIGVPPKGRRIVKENGYHVVYKDGITVGKFATETEAERQSELWGVMDRGRVHDYTVEPAKGSRIQEFVKPLQDNEMMIYVAGRPVRMQINDPATARQLRPLNKEQMNAAFRVMQWANRHWSRMFTGYNPVFIFTNLARDIQTGTFNMIGNYGAITAGKTWVKHYTPALVTLLRWAATGKVPSGKMGEMLVEYRSHGGKVGASHMGDLEAHHATIQGMFDKHKGVLGYAAEGRVVKASALAVRKTVRAMAHTIEILNQGTENALRLALYVELRSQGATPGRAAQAAKTVTVDFDRKGTATGAMGALYLFFNPAVQGTANASKTVFKGKHKFQAQAALGMYAALGFWIASLGYDEDKDKWLGMKWDERTKFLMLNMGNRQLRIPLSQEFAPAYAVGVAMAEAARGEKVSTTLVRLMSSVIDAYVPLRNVFDPDSDNHGADIGMALIPTIGQVPAQVITNRNSFGSDLMPESDFTRNRPDNLKMNRTTKGTVYDRTAQGIAAAGTSMRGAGKYENDLSKISPETLKLIWMNLTGGVGTFVADSVGAVSLASDDFGEVGLQNIPITKSFVREPGVKPLRSRFFELTADARKSIDQFDLARKNGDGEEMDRLLDDPKTGEMVSLSKFIKSQAAAAREQRDLATEINADESLTMGQKRAKLKELEAEEEAIYREAIKAFQQ